MVTRSYRIISGLLFFSILGVGLWLGNRVANSGFGESAIIDRRESREVTPQAHLAFVAKSVDYTKAMPVPRIVTQVPPIDFQSRQAALRHASKDLAFVKIGFHVGPGGNLNGIGEWWGQNYCNGTPSGLDGDGIPIFLKSTDNPGPLFEVQEIAKKCGVPHILVYRATSRGQNDGYDYDVPNYYLSPEDAAIVHWDRHVNKFLDSPELDKDYIWLETINEVARAFVYETESELDSSGYNNSPYRAKYQNAEGKWVLSNSEWLAKFALETSHLALRDGYKWAAFGWSSGEPEPEDWEGPIMMEFLRLAAQYPDQIAVSLHEYSYKQNHIGAGYPFLIGRFQRLFEACDRHGVPRPTVFITEWGWEYQNVPGTSEAIDDIRWASTLYAAYPTVKGAAIWNLGGGSEFGQIYNQVNKLIDPLTEFTRQTYFEIYPGPAPIDDSLFTPPPARTPEENEMAGQDDSANAVDQAVHRSSRDMSIRPRPGKVE